MGNVSQWKICVAGIEVRPLDLPYAGRLLYCA